METVGYYKYSAKRTESKDKILKLRDEGGGHTQWVKIMVHSALIR